jgi:hypothetical protein
MGFKIKPNEAVNLQIGYYVAFGLVPVYEVTNLNPLILVLINTIEVPAGIKADSNPSPQQRIEIT